MRGAKSSSAASIFVTNLGEKLGSREEALCRNAATILADEPSLLALLKCIAERGSWAPKTPEHLRSYEAASLQAASPPSCRRTSTVSQPAVLGLAEKKEKQALEGDEVTPFGRGCTLQSPGQPDGPLLCGVGSGSSCLLWEKGLYSFYCDSDGRKRRANNKSTRQAHPQGSAQGGAVWEL